MPVRYATGPSKDGSIGFNLKRCSPVSLTLKINKDVSAYVTAYKIITHK